MNIFMETLKEKEISWYEGLPLASLYSLKYFHENFYENYRKSYPSLLLVENCCEHVERYVQHLESFYCDEEFTDE